MGRIHGPPEGGPYVPNVGRNVNPIIEPMQPRVLACIAVCFTVCAAVSAADFWETKPFLEWSDKEAEKVLSDSPWATTVAVPLPNVGPVPSGDINAGGRGGGEGRGDGFGPGPRRVRVAISWRSALPLKQALVRQQVGLRGTVSSEAQAMLSKDDEFYVVGVMGLPPQFTQAGAKTIEAFLRRVGKTPIPAQQAGSQMLRGGSLLLIAFPRTDPITLDDGDVEFDVKLDQLEIRKKFRLKDLTFNGKLTL
jgi:hypothetical protein